MALKYLGPSDVLKLEDKEGAKEYHPGDEVPISKERAQHLADQTGHMFEGIDQDETPTAPAETWPAPVPVAPAKPPEKP